MASSPKSSLVERLVQDRLRSGDLEASAAQLLHLADGGAGTPAARAPTPEQNGGEQHGSDATVAYTSGGPDLSSEVLVAEPEAAPPALDLRPVMPAALELRPAAEPDIAPLSPFPLPGIAPSALVPPPTTALPVTAQPAAFGAPAAPVVEPAAPRRETVPAAPRQIIPPAEPERPDLVQGPPTIDAVALERGGMVDWSRTRSRISEEFRLVQRQILRAAFGPGAEPGFSNLLMITSARPGEGKSFTSVNLAGSVARQGDHHVLLVDADSKRDSFCYALGLAEMRGLLDLVANPKLDPSPLIVKTPIDRLSILPVGRERERSAELFSTKEMTRLIQSLGRRYADRLLVLDAPPCLSTSDPAVLAPVVGQILFVVEADRTQRDEVEASLDLIQACPNITMVLNKQQISSRYTFGAYSSYYSS
jgi:protein-tyrosine kinase